MILHINPLSAIPVYIQVLNFVNSVPVDNLAPNFTRPSAGTVLPEKLDMPVFLQISLALNDTMKTVWTGNIIQNGCQNPAKSFKNVPCHEVIMNTDSNTNYARYCHDVNWICLVKKHSSINISVFESISLLNSKAKHLLMLSFASSAKTLLVVNYGISNTTVLEIP